MELTIEMSADICRNGYLWEQFNAAGSKYRILRETLNDINEIKNRSKVFVNADKSQKIYKMVKRILERLLHKPTKSWTNKE